MSQSQILKSKNSTILAARIFHSMRPLIEVAIGMMPEEAPAKKLMKEFEKYQIKELEYDLAWGEQALDSEIAVSERKSSDLDEIRPIVDFFGPEPGALQTQLQSRARRKAEIGMKRGRKPQTYRCNGEEKTLAEWSKITGLSYGTLIKRLNENIPLDAPKGRVGRRKKNFDNNLDQIFESSSDRAALEEVPRPEKVSQPGRRAKLPPLTIHDKTQSVQDWARDSGLSVATILARLDRGWSAEKAISLAPMMRGRRGPKATKAVLNSFKMNDTAPQSLPRVILRKKHFHE